MLNAQKSTSCHAVLKSSCQMINCAVVKGIVTTLGCTRQAEVQPSSLEQVGRVILVIRVDV